MENKRRITTTDALRRKEIQLLDTDPERYFDMRRKSEHWENLRQEQAGEDD